MNQDFNVEKKQIVFGEDSVIIQKWEGDIKGGRALDFTGITDKTISAGRVIVTDGKGTYKPLAIADGAYSTKADGYSYAGVLFRSIANGDSAAIMTAGQVNKVAAKAANGAEYPADFAAALPKIAFVADEDANKYDESDATIDND